MSDSPYPDARQTGTASGMLVDIPVSVTVTLANKAAQDRGAARMTVTATARVGGPGGRCVGKHSNAAA